MIRTLIPHALSAGAALALAAAASGQGGAGLLRPQDVVAVVGGEDLVTAGDYGYLEYLVLRERPQLQLRFRSLTKEGDTAFEQARDFNYPPLEQQLAEIGTTVVLVQLGRMESLRGKDGLPDFERATVALLERLGDGGKRRVILIAPTPLPADSPAAPRFAAADAYREAIARIAQRQELPCIVPGERQPFILADYRNGVHLNERGQFKFAAQLAEALVGVKRAQAPSAPDERRLLELIQAKNQLWYHYVRPQNWAFLDGDRTVQPASRDHRNPEIRWFPEEMKAWLPLVAERENEAWALARRLPAR